jgi:ferredoxin, 2Fe-2S
MNVQIADREGRSHSIVWEPGQSLMETLRDNDMVLALCGGHCICGTCHVYVEADAFAALPPRGDEEIAQLEQMRGFRPEASRLSCQIPFSQARPGMRIVLAPNE